MTKCTLLLAVSIAALIWVAWWTIVLWPAPHDPLDVPWDDSEWVQVEGFWIRRAHWLDDPYQRQQQIKDQEREGEEEVQSGSR